jgi:hypothetical protein
LVYVDDTLLFSHDEKYINEVIQKLRLSDMELEDEDSVAGFLGVHIQHNDIDGSIKLTQEGLAKWVVDSLSLGNCACVLTPAYNYVSVIGMLQYLRGHSRPDITYAVSQCARYVHSPKQYRRCLPCNGK